MEQVLVVETPLLAPYISGRRGLIQENLEAVLTLVQSQHSFLPRDTAENDPTHKQIIPYVVVRRSEQVFATRRLNRGGETRLHGRLSLGAGGHINPTDDKGDVLFQGLRRELDEELCLTGAVSEPRLLGLINDDDTEVGRVHLGLCFLLDTDGDVSVRETEKLEGLWLPLSQLANHAEEMETWSSLLLDTLTDKGE